MEDFRWLLHNVSLQPTRIKELLPMHSSAEGHHGASGKGASGFWFPVAHLTPREGASSHPLVWHLRWPQHITDLLVTDANPTGTITNSDLEISPPFDIREYTVLSDTNNLNTLFWQQVAPRRKKPRHTCCSCLTSTSIPTPTFQATTTWRDPRTRRQTLFPETLVSSGLSS